MAKKEKQLGFNINSFIKGSEQEKDVAVYSTNTPETTNDVPKQKKVVKKKQAEDVPAVVGPAFPTPQSSMSYIQENIPYAMAYQETNQQLDESITQLNILGGELMQELQSVRASKTLRNKYNYINDMTTTCTSIISAKLAAIKEKNKTINDVSHLELSRLKELKSQANAEDDNTRIASMYDAFINTPISMGRGVLAPPMQDMMMADSAIPQAALGSTMSEQAAWEQSLDPAQNRMILEAKGAVETIVVYDNATGNRWFDVVDKVTRQSVPNVERPDNSYIYDIDINVRGGFAKDSMRNKIYPLLVLNAESDSINQY
jgi:hypothetical protein